MEFENAASFFDDDPVYDAYTGAFLFFCHTTPHDDHTSSGATARRRTMTTINTTVPPARRAIKLYNEYWIVGNSNPDGFRGVQVRRSYGLKKSSGLIARLTPGEAASGAAGVPFYAHKEYFRDMAEARASADWDTMWNIFCPLSEAVGKGTFLRQDGVLFRVRNAYPSIEELLVAEADQLDDDAEQAAVFTSAGALNLITDTYPVTSVAAGVIQTDVQKYYVFRTQAESAHQPGDRTVFVAKSALTPKVGDTFRMMAADWRIVLVASEHDSWALQARLA